MRPFDTVVAVDWSGADDTGPTPRPDAIWTGVVRTRTAEPPLYLRSRAVAEDWMAGLIEGELAAGRRLLLGIDFPFGYPAGLAERVAGRAGPHLLWDWFAQALDALPKDEGRFDLAARINRSFSGEGPFWFNGLKREIEGLPRTRPSAPPEGVAERREVELRAPGAFACWQMGGGGAVGSQAMTGMATLARLRRRFPRAMAVWPFDPWDAAPVVVVEVWPSLLKEAVERRMSCDATLPRDREGRPIKDAAQVAVLSEALGLLGEWGRLDALLSAAPEAARMEEGWILGVGAEALLASGAASTPAPSPLRDDCFALPPGVDWTPVGAALARLRERLAPVTGTEAVPVVGALGRVLAEDAVARRASPPAANAAVDGYGFAHAAVVPGDNVLPLVPGRAAAGAPLGRPVPPGRAARILTGALLPAGVDTVILQEDARAAPGHVAFAGPVKPRANTRAAGEDVEAGAVALPMGRRLTPPDLALLSGLGVAEVAVRARLRVGVLSTGDELAGPGETDDPARTFDANRPMLLALLGRWDHEAVDLGRVADDRAALRARLDGAGCDAVLTSGGASAGEEDHVSALLTAEGRVETWRVAMKPGRPLALGLWRGVPVFGLPGNPVAAFVCALVFARPALSALAGSGWPEPQGFDLPAAFAKRKRAGRREFLRARVRDGRAEVFASEGSGRVSGLSWAEGLVELPEEAREIAPGDPVRYLPYGSFGL